jgi:hypothetical protein
MHRTEIFFLNHDPVQKPTSAQGNTLPCPLNNIDVFATHKRLIYILHQFCGPLQLQGIPIKIP